VEQYTINTKYEQSADRKQWKVDNWQWIVDHAAGDSFDTTTSPPPLQTINCQLSIINSLQPCAAGNFEDLAGNERRIVRSEKERRSGHIIGRSDPA